MASIPGSQIWKSINSDANFLALPEEQRRMVRPYIERMSGVLEEYMDKPADFVTIMLATREFLRHCFYQSYVERLLRITSDAAVGASSRHETYEVLKQMCQEAIVEVEKLCAPENAAQYFQSLGITEDQAILDLNLNEVVSDLYLKGDLKIADLVVLKPMVFYQPFATLTQRD